MAPKKTIEKTKKPLSGYMKYAKERRAGLLKEKPSLSFGEVCMRARYTPSHRRTRFQTPFRAHSN